MKKSVLITGASGSIGQAIAEEFAKNGYDIIATYNKHEISNKLRYFCKECEAKLIEYKLDITDTLEVKKVFEKAFKEVDFLDCVVCNSGISLGEKMLCDITDEEISKTIQTNLVGTIYCNREASKHMLKQKHGNIINISSIYGVNGGSCESVYSASKAGVIGLTKTLAKELAESSIRVNAVAPGYVESNMTACFTAEEKEAIRQEYNLAKLAIPEDVAKVVYDVAEVNTSFNGEVVFID